MAGALPAEFIQAGPHATITLTEIVITFPTGYWDDPSHALQLASGGTMGDARINGIGLVITQGIRQLLADRASSLSVS